MKKIREIKSFLNINDGDYSNPDDYVYDEIITLTSILNRALYNVEDAIKNMKEAVEIQNTNRDIPYFDSVDILNHLQSALKLISNINDNY